MSLDAASDDDMLTKEITSYWDLHLPIMLCVGGDYEYYALHIPNGFVVNGYEPEFEESTQVATSFLDFLSKIMIGEINV